MSVKNHLKFIRYESAYYGLENLCVITASGNDVESFLNGQLTSSVVSMDNGSFHTSCVLDISGRYISHFLLVKVDVNHYKLLVSQKLMDLTLKRLNKYLISEDVDLDVDKSKKYYAIWGFYPNELKGYRGRLFNEQCLLIDQRPNEIPQMKKSDYDVLKFASGEPEFELEIKSAELVTNSFLTQVSIGKDKGCYPGQETVSKILNNKGASFYPVCLLGDGALDVGELKINNKKVGEVRNLVNISGLNYHYVLINRENRVEGKTIEIENNSFTVKYFPLFPNDLTSKAQDLYFDAIEEFKLDKESVAIDLLNKAIELQPDFEDAYESLGVIYGREGDNHKAIELMKKLSELNPKSVMAHTNLSLYYMKIGDKETAEHHKAEATLKQFEVLGDQAKRKREIEQKQQQELAELDRKEKMFKEVLEIDPEDALANHGLGEIEYKRKNYLKSECYLKKAIETDPKYSVAYLLLAKVLKDSMKTEEFAKVAEEGIKIATKNGDMMPANELQLLLNEK